MENLENRNSNIVNNSLNNFKYNDIQKMIFLCNALNDGWTIRKVMEQPKSYEFTKSSNNIKKDYAIFKINISEEIEMYINKKNKK